MSGLPGTIFLFDVDGTLTKSRQVITPEMSSFLQRLRAQVVVGIVGGSDLGKIEEQMGGSKTLADFDYVFSENGLVTHQKGKLVSKESFLNFLGEDRLQKLVNFCLRYVADLEIPQKRGTFIEFRAGLLNVSPIGRNCSQSERDAFEEYDKEHGVRAAFVKALRDKFPDYGLQYSIGGQISFDVFPRGWDKTYCLQRLLDDKFTTIHFFGDKTFEGGNDYEIFVDPRTVGHTVTSPEDTMCKVEKLIASLNAAA
ncbi:phosphomannomutase [Ixodes scapularis]|uniref:Phosphomannomutase n=1 Tax=Ixodes scapularis TaxID=6945 RepID=B7QIG2_IXOSC|nr:phosphomannomutase [Ixodes scapularis]EEC18634.1 phosphomannomutase, putative [Ixodes scapularis]|eukprot:XP_002414969.1 phosphomannomutase, putative [Ixodes scapularis]